MGIGVDIAVHLHLAQHFVARACRGPPAASCVRPKATLPPTVRCGNSAKSWNTSPTWRCSGGTRTRAAGSPTASPRIDTRPLCSVSRPAARRSTVDLPQPDGPTRHTTSPAFTDSDTPATARTRVVVVLEILQHQGVLRLHHCVLLARRDARRAMARDSR